MTVLKVDGSLREEEVLGTTVWTRGEIASIIAVSGQKMSRTPPEVWCEDDPRA
jgi:hypothetical protein